ncbi:MAG: hypothetical protein K2O34_07785 [Acetatifactor sp.]|nr:hypothetical protein [Acetatifactor sp.]
MLKYLKRGQKRIPLAAGLVLLTAAGALLGALLLSLAFYLPVREEYAAASYAVLDKEGWYPAAPIMSKSLDTYFHSLLPGVLDNNTDSIMLYTALDQSEGSGLIRAMNMYNAYMQKDYSYYWHGYVILLRPLLYFMDYSDLRLLNCGLQLLLLILLTGEVWRRRGLPYALAALTSYMLLMPVAMALSLQFTWVFYIAMGGALLLTYRGDKMLENGRYLYCFLALGMLTSFLDLLTYPLFTWGVPLVWWLAMRSDCSGAVKRLRQVVSTGLCWILGYGGMWLGKWVLATLVLRRNVIREAVEEIFLRTGVEDELQSWGLAERWEAVYTNWKHYEYIIYAILLLAWLIWIVVRSLGKNWKATANSCAYALTGLSAFVWYMVLSNHTGGHHFFAYRNFGVSVLAFLLLYIEAVYVPDKISGGAKVCRSRKVTFGIWFICGIGGVLLALCARDKISVMNGDMPMRLIEIGRGESLETSFIPASGHVISAGVGMSMEGSEGYFLVTVEEQGTIVCQEQFPVTEYKGNVFCSFPVDWHLKKGGEYVLRVEPRDISGPVYAYITEADSMSLSELRGAVIAGEDWNGQPLAGLTYFQLPVSKRRLVMLACAWMSVLAAFCIAGYSLTGRKDKLRDGDDGQESK